MFSVVTRKMNTWTVALVAMGLIAASAAGWCADDWPSQVTVGGFSVTNINPSSSTSARGTLQVPGVGGRDFSLSRSSKGDITGSGSISGRVSGVDIQGDFKLDNSGLKCRGGVVKTSPKPITDADITVSNRGDLSGRGRMELGSNRVNVDINASGSNIRISGSTSARASAETQLAKYSFDGKLELQGGSGGSVGVVAQGKVERRGKLAEQVSTYNVSNIKVDPSNGNGAANIDGVNVTFDFF